MCREGTITFVGAFVGIYNDSGKLQEVAELALFL